MILPVPSCLFPIDPAGVDRESKSVMFSNKLQKTRKELDDMQS